MAENNSGSPIHKLVRRSGDRILVMKDTGEIDKSGRHWLEGQEEEDVPLYNIDGSPKIDPVTGKQETKRGIPRKAITPEHLSDDFQAKLAEELANDPNRMQFMEETLERARKINEGDSVESPIEDGTADPELSTEEEASAEHEQLVEAVAEPMGETAIDEMESEAGLPTEPFEETPDTSEDEKSGEPEHTKEGLFEQVERAAHALEYQVGNFFKHRGYEHVSDGVPTSFEALQQEFIVLQRQLHDGGIDATSAEAQLSGLVQRAEAGFINVYEPFQSTELRLIGQENPVAFTPSEDSELRHLQQELNEVVPRIEAAKVEHEDFRSLLIPILGTLRDEIIPRMRHGYPVQDMLYTVVVQQMNHVSGQDENLRRATGTVKAGLRDLLERTKVN
jgi:hypothetical protein